MTIIIWDLEYWISVFGWMGKDIWSKARCHLYQYGYHISLRFVVTKADGWLKCCKVNVCNRNVITSNLLIRMLSLEIKSMRFVKQTIKRYSRFKIFRTYFPKWQTKYIILKIKFKWTHLFRKTSNPSITSIFSLL